MSDAGGKGREEELERNRPNGFIQRSCGSAHFRFFSSSPAPPLPEIKCFHPKQKAFSLICYLIDYKMDCMYCL